MVEQGTILLAINIISTESATDDATIVERRRLDMSHFATTQVKDELL